MHLRNDLSNCLNIFDFVLFLFLKFFQTSIISLDLLSAWLHVIYKHLQKLQQCKKIHQEKRPPVWRGRNPSLRGTLEDTWEDSSGWEQQETLLIRSSNGARSLHLDPPKRKKKVIMVSEEERCRKNHVSHRVNHNNEVLIIRFCPRSRWKTAHCQQEDKTFVNMCEFRPIHLIWSHPLFFLSSFYTNYVNIYHHSQEQRMDIDNTGTTRLQCSN